MTAQSAVEAEARDTEIQRNNNDIQRATTPPAETIRDDDPVSRSDDPSHPQSASQPASGSIPPATANGTDSSTADPVNPEHDTNINGGQISPVAANHRTPEPHEPSSTKKRKRPASPPWQFPTAAASTLKTADGRRISARFNAATPTQSESDERSRSVSQSASKSRAASPPWKKFGAEGPTSISVDGRRKSGRVNKELVEGPKRVSPRSKRLGKAAAATQHADIKAASSKAMAGKYGRGGRAAVASESSRSSNKIAALQAQIAALQPSRSFAQPAEEKPKRGYRRKEIIEEPDSPLSDPPSSPEAQPARRRPGRPPKVSTTAPVAAAPKLKLRLTSSRYHVEPPHPQAKVPSPAQPPQRSLWQLLDDYELKELQQPFLEGDKALPSAEFFSQRAEKQALDEGAMRQRLLREAQPGGALSREKLSLFRDDRQREPPAQYGHHDHLVAHALYLRQLQLREKLHHRTIAKKIAHEALEYWRAMNGPTEEDIIQEQNKIFELIRKQVVIDMKAKWDMVEAHVREIKRLKWEAEEKQKKQELLRKKLDTAQIMLAKQRGEIDSEDDELEEDSTGDIIQDEDESDDSDSDDEIVDENMSDSSSDSEAASGEEEGEMDEEALAAYLAQRQAEPPDRDDDSDGEKSEVAAGNNDDHHSAHESDGDQEMVNASAAEGTLPDKDTDARGASQDLIKDENGSDAEESETGPQRRTRTRGNESRSASPPGAEVEAEKHLSSDESTDMDSEDYDSDEDMSSTGDEADSDDEAEDEEGAHRKQSSLMKNSLLALFSPKELLAERDGSLPTPVTSVENGGDARSSPEARSEAHETHEEPDAAMDIDRTEPKDSANSLDDRPQEPTPFEEEPAATGHSEKPEAPAEEDAKFTPDSAQEGGGKALVPSVPVPTLLRGMLRSYQHAGLNWLASLYRNGTNGILADEMGLGKTIQTISVLAHVAEEYAVWEPHLVIVPTSVILNWATEFQKFLPGFRVLAYYGTQEERSIKRRGWANDPHHENKEKRGYNVVITSYNIAMQDISSLRNVQWHYLILDEAHNIRNYNSQRWKVLIRLRSKARILLTGTPLQNNLDEVWALLTFLRTGDEDESSGHGELEEFLSHWEPIVKQIFQDGADKLSAEAQTLVKHLHVSLRPFLLRRQKSEVERDLPKKTERVVVCKLSKRQRQLYQDYMGLAETKATLAKGSGVQAGAVLLSLRRVCNHPDLFDPRPIQTSFAMARSPLEEYSVKERLVRELLGVRKDVPDTLLPSAYEHRRRASVYRSRKLDASTILTREARKLEQELAEEKPDPTTLAGSRAFLRLQQRQRDLQRLRAHIQVTEAALRDAPVYGADLCEILTVRSNGPYISATRRPPVVKSVHAWPRFGHYPLKLDHHSDWMVLQTTQLYRDTNTVESYASRLQDTIVKFAFVPPAATAPILDIAIPPKLQETLRSDPAYPAETTDFAHEARVRLSIAFPDARLLVFDSGKLQQLTYLLRDLQARGSRSLIFTQMVGTLDILERFLNLLGMPYLRLDGSTGVERRQLYSAEFNRPDSKYQCMILSSRAGGVGLNLTGASSVIFYDLDWNPQMDRQCMDRAHRIGQVRDVEVYKMVSEKTVEENILRRANQKSLLDQTVIQEGHFTTEHDNAADVGAAAAGDGTDVDAAIERLLGGNEKSATQALESVEDKEDVQAAQAARKEDQHQSDLDAADDFTSSTPAPAPPEIDTLKEERKGHVDAYMIGFVEAALEGWRYAPPPARKVDKHGRDPSHRPKKRL